MRNIKKNISSNSGYKYSCTMIVPGLLGQLNEGRWSEDYAAHCENNFQPEELELFLSKSKQQDSGSVGYEEVLFEVFGQTTSSGQPFPIAPACYLADADATGNNNSTGWCLRADPVQLTPDRDELILSGSEVLSLSMSEAEYLVTELNVLFKEDGFHLEAITASRWYLHLPEDPKIKTSDLSQVRGRPISQFLPGGPEGKQWHRILNEVQMVLHTSEVNIKRQNNGQPPVNSLWFWGGGKLPELSHSDWSQVWSDEVLSQGLAKVTRTPCLSVPKNSKTWLEQVNAPGEHLIIYDEMALQSENDPDDWCRALQKFEYDCLAPLIETLRKGDIDELTLNPCDGRTYSLTKRRLNYWWRRRKPILSFCR